MRKPTVSPSKIAMYLKCPKQFESHYIEKLPHPPEVAYPLVKGKLIHRALEIMAGQSEINIHLAVMEATTSMEREGYGAQKMLPSIEIVSESEKIIKSWYNEQKFEGLIQVEEQFMEDDGDVVWNGIKDKKQMINNILRIVDYKTGGKMYSSDELRDDPQIIIYAWSEMKNNHDQQVEVVIDMVEKQKETIPVSYTWEEIQEKMDYLRIVAKEMYSAETFKPQLGSHCHYCDHQCQAYSEWIAEMPDLTTAPNEVKGVEAVLSLYKELTDKIKIMEGRKNQMKEYIIGVMVKYGHVNVKGKERSCSMTNRTNKTYDKQSLLQLLPPSILSQVLTVDTRKLDTLLPNLPGELRTQVMMATTVKDGSPYIIVR